MKSFEAGQRVRVTPEFANVEFDDGSFKAIVGVEGIVERFGGYYYHVPITDPTTGETFTHAFDADELEAV